MGVHHGACRPIVSDMNLPASRGDWDALRVLFWIALALLFTNSVIWPGFLDGPVSKLGDNDKDAFAMDIHWFPVALLGWLVVAAVWRSLRRSRGVRLSAAYPRSPDVSE